jgi:CrcB protein
VIVLALACAGALGAPSRYLLEATISRRAGHGFPWGTACVNLVGSFSLGLLVGLREFHNLDGNLSTIAGIGFLGAFTTFSTFAVETTRLSTRARVLYIGLSVVGGIACAALGLALASI